MAVYENYVKITSAATWTKVAETAAAQTLDLDYVLSNYHADDAVVQLGYGTDTTAPSESVITQTVVQYGLLTGSEVLGANRALWVKSDKTDTRIRAAGIK